MNEPGGGGGGGPSMDAFHNAVDNWCIEGFVQQIYWRMQHLSFAVSDSVNT